MIEPSWVGRRVSVRRVLERRPDGRLLQGDVVGDLVALDPQAALVEARGGLVEVPLALVTIAKLAPPSTADELALQRVIAAGWRAAEVTESGGWTLRADHGFTQRANSVLPLRQLTRPLDEALADARDWYAARGLPLRFQIPVEARRLLDAELGERGFDPGLEVAVLVRRLDPTAPAAAPDLPVSLDAVPDDAWSAVWRAGSTPDVARDLLVRHDRVTFASLRQDGHTVAVGRATVDDGWVGITCVEVAPGYRRQGLAGRIMAALETWGRGHAAARAVLEVESDNAGGLALYRRLGYWHHHDYRYRVGPAA